jgi:hypothetical protein
MLAVLVFSVQACGPADRANPPDGIAQAVSTGSVAVDSALAMTNVCLNRTEGYAIGYPAGWHVNTDEVVGACALFDVDPIRIPTESELPLEIAITVGFEAGPFAMLSGDVLGRRILSREPAAVDGREAIRIEAETTGEGLHDRGIRSYQYLVDLGDTTMVAATYDVGELSFERKRVVLDAMMATFDFRQPG